MVKIVKAVNSPFRELQELTADLLKAYYDVAQNQAEDLTTSVVAGYWETAYLTMMSEITISIAF